ncbi:MATE family efflux transporter [Cupriavidus basilensis]|uniref:MATE family efflux transporter n=1 Tax=Cupriavidus basilensis TaxID=68895 RepID=UPI0028458BCF|nr:MATE family efflux transporter [Cupriavidus basilensis]MDR3381389.1 MATE family efflux transporter [Cupriavidus basilensis]
MPDADSPLSAASSASPASGSASSAPPALPASHWHRRVLALAFPIILANLTQPILGAVDTAVAGHLPDPAYLGGVAAGGLFFSFVFWGFGFLRMGTTGLVAQAYGAQDGAALRATLARALMLATVIGLGVLAVQMPLIHGALGLIGGSDTLQHHARVYSHARIWAAPFALCNYVVLGYLLGCQHVRLGLLIQLFINAVNIAAVLLYVYVFDWGIAGIGAATATADACGFVLGAVLLWRLRPHGLAPLRWAVVADAHELKRLVALNRDIFIRTLCLVASFGWFAHAGARQGDVILAANALLLNFQTFMAYALDGFAHAAEALVGAAIGTRDRHAFRRAVRVTMIWGAVGALCFSLVYASAGEWIIACLTDQRTVHDAAVRYLPWAVALPLVSVWGFLLDGVFIGATSTRDLMRSMAVSFAAFMVAALTLAGPFGNDGLWAALLLFMAARGVTLARVFPRIEASRLA